MNDVVNFELHFFVLYWRQTSKNKQEETIDIRRNLLYMPTLVNVRVAILILDKLKEIWNFARRTQFFKI